jgi:hypothetical protein
LILVLLGGFFLFTTGLSNRLLTALFPQTSPSPSPSATSASPTTPDLAATFDSLSTQVAEGVGAALATRDALATYEATINAPTSTPMPTPDLTATVLAACTFDMAVINDEAIQPSALAPGEQFVKQWTVQNTGSCAWPEDIRLVFVSGDELDVVIQPEIESLSPNGTREIQIALQAPSDAASYTSVWQLQYGEGSTVGERLEVTFRVDLTPTPRPATTPMATPTPKLTSAPRELLWMSIPGVAQCDEGRTRGRIEWGRGGGPSDEYRYFHGEISPESELAGSYNEFAGFPHVETYFTTSGTLEFPVPEDCCPGDRGRYVSPKGYEIVWEKVWHSAGSCP